MVLKTTIPNLDLAIHLISKYAQIEEIKATENPVKFVELLVLAYNSKKAEGPKKDHIFERVETPQWNRKDNQDCFLIAYYSKRINDSPPAKFLKGLTGDRIETYQDVNFHFAFFVYFSISQVKQKQIESKTQTVWALFTLTSSQAFHLIRPYCDYAFPTRIAFRLVEPSCSKKEIVPLVGPKEASTSYYKKPYELKAHEYESLWVLYRNFDSELRAGCSLSSLLKLADSKQIGMHIGEGMIRIGSALTFEQYVSILPHLLDIRRGNPTYKSDGTLEEDDPSFQVFANIQRINSKQQNILDQLLIDILWKAVTQDNFSTTLYLSHRRYREYHRSTEFKLQMSFKGYDYHVPWSYRPTLHQVILELQTLYKDLPLADFVKVILNSSMRCNGLGSQYHPLIQFIQGELVLEEDAYFRVGGVWLRALGQHLATTETAFRAVVQDTLARITEPGDHILRDPWISKEDWVSFSRVDIPQKVSVYDFDKAMTALQKQTFQFVDSTGKVLVSYLTRAILHNQDLKMIKSLKKKWDELSNWLKDNHGKAVKEDDLKELFPKNYAKVFASLKNVFPVIAPLQKREGSVAPVAKDGSVQLADLTLLEMPKSAPKYITKNLPKLSELLRTLVTVSEESLSLILKGHKTKGLEWLKTAHKLNPAASSRYVFQGPLPTGIVLSTPVQEFFQAKHKEFCLLMDEENYSRLFLGKRGYLVCDQVFPGIRDKVELFDLLYFGDEKKLYLYAIKEGFGTSTGIACTQIRVAAETIDAARKNDSGKEILENLYETAISTKATSVFRKKLIKDLKQLSKEEFVQLFRTRELVFVYAFLDTNQEDRRLENELIPQALIQLDILKPTTNHQNETDATLLRHLLIAMGYLDQYYKITDHFIRSTTEPFKSAFEPFAKKVWQGLIKYKTKEAFFQQVEIKDTNAKKALLDVLQQIGYLSSEGTTDYFTKVSEEVFVKTLLCFDPNAVYKVLCRMLSQFDSLIAKMELIKLKRDLKNKDFKLQIQQLERPGPKALKALFNVVNPQAGSYDFFGTAKITYLGKDYFYRKNPKTLKEVFTTLMGQKDSYLAQRIFYQMTNNNNGLVDSTFDVTEPIVIQAAALSGTSLIIYDVNQPDQTLKPKKEDHFTLIVKRGMSYFYTSEVKISPLDSSKAIKSIVDEISKKNPPNKPMGITNRKNDCFMNAMLQLLIYSPLFNLLISGQNNNDPICNTFLSFILQYLEGNKLPSSHALRVPLKLSTDSQEDVQEALTHFLDAFNLNDKLPLLTITKTINGEKAQEMSGKNLKEYSPLEDVLNTKTSSPTIQLPIPPHEKPTLFDCWSAFSTQESEDQLFYSQGTQVFQVPCLQTTYKLQNKPPTLFFHFLRYLYNKNTGQTSKVETGVEIPEKFEVNSSMYEVGGFINHHGDNPQNGHYTCHVKNGNSWFLCDDDKISDGKSFDDVKKALSQSYLLMVRKIN